MAKLFVPQSSCIFAIIIFVLLVLSVGLLVFVLKGQLHHENSLSLTGVPHVGDTPRATTHTPSPHTAPKAATTRSPDPADVPMTPLLDETPWLDFRLPKYIVPLHYDLLLHPDLERDTFTGTVNITVNVTRNTKHFVVHAYRLVIKDSKVLDVRQDVELGVEKQFAYSPHEYFVVSTERVVEPGPYQLSFGFGGTLNGTIVGFYKSRYKNSRNETRYLATSKFQPTYARRAFPCFDEPSFKSTFSVALVHKEEYTALSNMPVEVTEIYSDSNLFVTKFQKSVPMVTYLACFIVCDFQYQGTTISSGKPFRVYTTPDQVNLTNYAMKFGSRVLEYFEKYFEIDYPLPKQDMVAIPDFSSGAMEHWGVITFRETNLLYDPENSSPQNLQRISAVISHEMTHMWFGNLVTMGWWEDLWLNEGFASYVEYKGVDEQHPEWDTLSQFVTEELQPVMNLDSTMNSHPIVQPVVHPDEITEIFDDISYGKGASILRMLEFFVGKDSFRTGISNFLKEYKYKNAKTTDLWEELSKSCGYQGNRSIAQIMKTWTEQIGFPYISIIRRGQNASYFVAKQRRFLKNRENYQQLDNTKESVWSVPLSYTTGSGKSGIVWLHEEAELRFSIPAKQDEWVKFNTNETGYYLVNYEKEEWQKFINLLMTNHEVLRPSDRSNLLFDSFLLAEEGFIDFDVFFSMSMYLKNETHLIPWETAYATFVYLCQLLESTEVNILLKSYMKDLTSDLYKKLGWTTSDSHLDNLLRTTIIGLACHSGNEDCLMYASELFQNWTQGQEVPSNLRSLVYNFGMAEIGREEHWNYMWNKYLLEDSPAQKKAIMNGLAHVRKPYLIVRYLGYAMDDENVRSQDFFTILIYIAGNPVGRPLVWNFIREKWPALVERFTLNNRYLGNAVKKICSYFTTTSELEQMKKFFAEYPDAGAGKRKRHQALEVVQNNIKWIVTNAPYVKAWLEVEGSAPWYYHRLPPHIVPEHYDLTLYPMLDTNKFNGSVAITVSLQKPSDCFLVHAKGLNISKVEVSSEKDVELVALEDVFPYEEYDYMVLKAKRKLPVGSYRLYFEFNGPLTLSLKGLYKSSYFDPKSKQRRYLATTQFAAVYARRAFPCFDEPMFRSTFNVSIIHNSSHFTLSNSMVENITEIQNDLLLTRFEKTLPMVTYLLCVVVSDFEFKETITEKGIKLRVYSAPHLIDKTNYALDVASKILTHYEDYYKIPFPLKKLDMVAIPDIMFNGMENWGLILYSEEGLISGNSSTNNYQTCKLIAHELAHMWFGDLVTMKWWDDVWLNEGFATYLAPKGLNFVEPEMDVENDGISRKLISALRSDQTISSHPIIRRVVDVNFGIYDAIAYSKAASILRMLENYMGEDFREGISAYLKKYSFSNARTEDLWQELSTASKKNLNISAVMDTWTRQMNYPFVVIEKDANASDHYTMQQHRFLENPDSKMFSVELSPYNYVWQIPMTFFTSEGSEVMHIMLNSSDKVNLSLPKGDWIKFNADFTGYYSVNYDLDGWKKLIQQMEKNHTVFRPSDRINLLYDAYSLASAGHLEYAVPLNLTRYLKNELYHGAWDLVLGELLRIKRYFKTERETREIIKEFIRSLSKDLLKKITWNDTGNYSERELRKLLIEAACESGNQDCLETAALLFKQWMKGTKQISPDISRMVYVYGLKVYNTEESWAFMWNRFLETSDPNEKLDLQCALATIRNTTLLERLMQFSKNESLIRKHNYFDVLVKVAQNSKGFPLVTHLIFNKWNTLVKTYGTLETANFAANVFKGYTTEKDLEKVRGFYRRQKKTREGAKAHLQALENIARNANWIRKHQTSVRTWMKNNVYMPWKGIRLPRHIYPIKYDITLHPNISLSTFNGTEEIELNITEKTNYILIHTSDLKITSTELRSIESGGGNIIIAEEFPYKRNEFYVIIFEEEIPSGGYVLKFSFAGKFSEDGRGLHRYQYTDRISGEMKYALATRFEATYARKLFPCFDEPAMKSKFKLSIIHHVNQTAVVSNMPEQETLPMPNNLVKTVFMESVQMSTYLLFCVVSDFNYLETEYKGKKVRAYAPSDRLHEAQHGLNLTVKLLEKLEEFFDVPYVLPKLDSVVIPNYTSSAMEHWGVIAYRTDRFLVNETLTEYKRIVDIERIIAHEIVHQWFGNLVTMNWWNDLWLNEGVSTLIMYIPLRQIYPSINEVNVRKMSRMMCADSGMNSHPVVHNVTTPDEIEQVFDVISYEKGGAVMKMLQHVLKDDFRKGLSNYLKKYEYRNAETKDLWAELSSVTTMDVNIPQMMDTWTRQMGFPYIELKRHGSTLTATQRWFSRTMNDSLAAKIAMEPRFSIYGFIWEIPLTYKNFATGNEYTLWLNERTAMYEINAMAEDVIKFNPGFVGFYIVKYDSHDWARLGKKLLEDHEAFSTTDRYNLLHDAFMLAETDRLIYDVPLELTKYLKKEKEALPWNLFRDHFLHFIRRLDGESEAVHLLQEYVARLTSELYDEFVDTSHNKSVFIKQSTSTGSCSYTYIDLQFIPTIVDLACRAGNQKCLNAVHEELQLWIHKQNTTSDIHFVLDIAISNFGNDTLWHLIYEELIANDTDKDRKYLLAEALVSFSDPIHIRKTIDTVAFDPLIDLELAKFMFQGLSNKDKAIPYVWNYTRNHWDFLMKRLDAKHNPSIGISLFCDKLKTQEYVPEFNNLMLTTEISEFIVEGCYEEIQNSVIWTDKYEETLTTWLTWNLSDDVLTHVN